MSDQTDLSAVQIIDDYTPGRNVLPFDINKSSKLDNEIKWDDDAVFVGNDENTISVVGPLIVPSRESPQTVDKTSELPVVFGGGVKEYTPRFVEPLQKIFDGWLSNRISDASPSDTHPQNTLIINAVNPISAVADTAKGSGVFIVPLSHVKKDYVLGMSPGREVLWDQYLYTVDGNALKSSDGQNTLTGLSKNQFIKSLWALCDDQSGEHRFAVVFTL